LVVGGGCSPERAMATAHGQDRYTKPLRASVADSQHAHRRHRRNMVGPRRAVASPSPSGSRAAAQRRAAVVEVAVSNSCARQQCPVTSTHPDRGFGQGALPRCPRGPRKGSPIGSQHLRGGLHELSGGQATAHRAVAVAEASARAGHAPRAPASTCATRLCGGQARGLARALLICEDL
jgi:hypothetical protein